MSDYPLQTQSLRSGGSIRSRSASELLFTQKTKLPCLSTVCQGQTDIGTNDISGLEASTAKTAGIYAGLVCS
jgi:hypothetical protein